MGASHARSCALLHLCLLKQQHSIYLFQSSLVSLVKYSRYDKFIQILHASFQPKCSKASPHGPMAWAALLASVETNTLPQRKFGNWSRLCPLLERISPVARVNHILQTHFSRWLFQQHMGISKKKYIFPSFLFPPLNQAIPESARRFRVGIYPNNNGVTRQTFGPVESQKVATTNCRVSLLQPALRSFGK